MTSEGERRLKGRPDAVGESDGFSDVLNVFEEDGELTPPEARDRTPASQEPREPATDRGQ